jgi:surface antigen
MKDGQVKINIDTNKQGAKAVGGVLGILGVFKKFGLIIKETIRSGKAKFLLDFFREYSTFTAVLLISILIIAGNLNKNKDRGFLFGFYDKNNLNSEEKVKQRIQKYSYGGSGLISAPLAIAVSAEDIKTATLKGQKLKQNEIQYQVLTATEPDAKELLSKGSDVAVYKVKNGDTVGKIAQEFKVTVNTILWANDIADISKIKPGDKIFILPVAGIKHKVTSTDTVARLAKKYKADEKKIISFNSLPADGRLKVGEEIIIPDGQKQPVRRSTPNSVLQPRTYYSAGSVNLSKGKRKPSIIDKNPKSKGRHNFPYGQCTWYVAQHRYVPWGGNAGTWLYHARAYGAKTGKTPKVGAIMVTSESWYGHVAVVTKVKGDSVTIKEMNYKGWAVVSSRTISAKSRRIKGYIY